MNLGMGYLSRLLVRILTLALLPISHAFAALAPPPTDVPEPASLGLLAVGAGALLVMRARKK